MLASALIVFREVFEAGLILGIVLSATRGVVGRAGWVAGGVMGGLLGACLVAVFAGAIGDAMQGSGQEVFNAGILLIAAVMLGWHNIWMARHGREMAGEMKALGRGVSDGSRTLLALAVVIGVAVLREGSEVVLFLYGLMVSGESGAFIVGGSALGLVGGGAVAALLYRGLVAIPTRQLFRVTNVMLSLLAAGMAAQAAGFLIQADLLPTWGAQIWNTSAMLDQKSIAGRALHALIGYTDRPAGLQIVVYAITLATLLLAGRTAAPRSNLRQGGGAPQRV
jgi:high-affinity iron transporter